MQYIQIYKNMLGAYGWNRCTLLDISFLEILLATNFQTVLGWFYSNLMAQIARSYAHLNVCRAKWSELVDSA